ncbi:MAG: hypothetical protein IJQ68_10430 [Methanobrevibacter sp.]|uniref:coiled-coil domain-containing protein n=1 Tax=Methanobrevibacter sp. TaxID=66852 RepID=UPI0025CC003C|nr:hypothetical protein [Methanobrevibacter sp.]MBR0272383.1 hypothetical protein [Methanobrevibacter sp.]
MTNHNCIHEERFASIESEIAEINARLDSKKEDIHQIQIEKDRQQRLQTELIEKVTRVTVLLEEGQKQRSANNKKIEDLEDKIDDLQKEVSKYRNDMTDFVSSQRSFRNTMLALIPVISIIVGVVLHFIRI